MGNFGKIELGVKPENCDRFVGNSEDRCSNTTEYRADNGPGGNRTPDRPRPTVLQLLSGTRTGEKRNLPKKSITFLGESKLGFPQKSSKISTSEHEAQEAQTEFVFAQTKFVFANFPKNVADFWGNWPQETARARSV